MVKRFSLFLLLLFVIMTSVCAQQIQGVVTDAVTGEPIPYLTVYYEGKGVGAITDRDGRYVVEKHPEWKEAFHPPPQESSKHPLPYQYSGWPN